jgi:Tfp pilus assembly protein PilF
VHLDPEASDKRYQLGVDYFAKGLVGPALEELLKAVELNPANAEVHNLLGLVFLRKGYEAEELSIRAQCLRGEELHLQKQDMETQFKKAETQFREAVRLQSDFSDALNNLAVVAIHFGRYDEAVTLDEKALSNIVYRDPFAAQGNLGMAYLYKHDYPHAAQALRQALFAQPKFCVGRFRLAKVYYEQKEYDRARDELEQVIGDSRCPIQEAFHLGGLVALRLQDRARAGELFSRCVQLAPRSCLARECTLAAEP